MKLNSLYEGKAANNREAMGKWIREHCYSAAFTKVKSVKDFTIDNKNATISVRNVMVKTDETQLPFQFIEFGHFKISQCANLVSCKNFPYKKYVDSFYTINYTIEFSDELRFEDFPTSLGRKANIAFEWNKTVTIDKLFVNKSLEFGEITITGSRNPQLYDLSQWDDIRTNSFVLGVRSKPTNVTHILSIPLEHLDKLTFANDGLEGFGSDVLRKLSDVIDIYRHNTNPQEYIMDMTVELIDLGHDL